MPEDHQGCETKRDESRKSDRPAVWDTAFPAALLFLSLHLLLPWVVEYSYRNIILFPVLGRIFSFAFSGLLAYGVLWAILHLVTISWLSVSDAPSVYLMMVNRQTGLRGWGTVGWILSFLGLVYSVLGHPWHIPLSLALLIGWTAARFLAEEGGWPVDSREREPTQEGADSGNGTLQTGEKVRNYFWNLDSLFRELSFSTEASFTDEEIQQCRKENPFRNKEVGDQDLAGIVRKLVLEGMRARQVKKISHYLRNESWKHRLSTFEEIQAALDFVQGNNIQYVPDDECPETGKGEYFRFPVETLYDKRGDCDCKSILAAALFKDLGYPVLIILGSNHAAVAVGGAPEAPEGLSDLVFVRRGSEIYYYCETTGEGWTVGQRSETAEEMMSDHSVFLDFQV